MTKPHSGKSRWRFGVPIPSERPPNRRVATLLCGLLFLIEGLALTIFGSVDVVNRGAGFHPRLVGFMFLLAGVLLIVEAFVLFAVSRRETPRLEGPAGTVALIAAVAGVAIGVYAFFAQLAGGGAEPVRIGLALLTTALFIAAFVFLKVRLGSPITVTAGVLIAALISSFSLYEFWYTQQYAPSTATGLVNIEATIESGPAIDGDPSLVASITTTNAGSTKVNVLASEYVVSLKHPLANAPDPNLEALAKPFMRLSDPPVEHYIPKSISNTGVIRAGRLFGDAYFLTAGETVTRRWVVDLSPEVVGQTVELRASVIFVNANQLEAKRHPTKKPTLESGVVTITYELFRPSVIQRVITNPEPLYLLVGYLLDARVPRPAAAVVKYNQVPEGEPGRVLVSARARRLGIQVFQTWATSETKVEPPPEQ